MSLCSIVKVDVSKVAPDHLLRVLRQPKLQGALLVATEVGDGAAFERCKELGFTYFQGEYFAQPRTFKHRGVGTSGIGSLRRLSELTAGDVSFEDLERIIGSDVGLSLKLLRYVNSAFFALPRTVNSVREALNMLGVRTVRRWSTVMVISSIPDVPDELVALGLRRAHMCEILAGSASAEERETLFTIGLFSVADALLDMPMAEVLDSLPFTDEIQTALLRKEGPKGELLAAVTAYERGEFPTLPSTDSSPSLAGAYRAALEWADEAGRVVA
jgi:c-di-GMP phosphodiesterase